jgi:hypothetical protein
MDKDLGLRVDAPGAESSAEAVTPEGRLGRRPVATADVADLPRAGQALVQSKLLTERTASVFTALVLKEAANKVTFLDKLKVWWDRKGFSFEGVKEAATINKALELAAKQVNGGMKSAGATSNENATMLKIARSVIVAEQRDFKELTGIMNPAVQIGDKKAMEFKGYLGKATIERYDEFKCDDASEKDVKNFRVNVGEARRWFEDPCVDWLLEVIDVAADLKSKCDQGVTLADILKLCDKFLFSGPDLYRLVVIHKIKLTKDLVELCVGNKIYILVTESLAEAQVPATAIKKDLVKLCADNSNIQKCIEVAGKLAKAGAQAR